MTAELRFFWARLNSNYWFYPALFALLGLALAFTCIWLDRNGFADFLNDLEALRPARPSSASNLLGVIAGSMIAVASTVFSITIVAVSFASGNYGPRLLTNFMADKGNQLSLATFIGTFVYALVVLRVVREEDESPATAAAATATALPGFVPQLSLLVAFVLMGLSVAVLVFFLNHVPSSIRINTVIEGVASRLMREIDDFYPDKGTRDGSPPPPTGEEVTAKGAGYVQLIDFEDLHSFGTTHDCDVVLRVRTGDFVHPGLPFLTVPERGWDEAQCAALRAAFHLGAARTPEQDPQFLIDELAEIALRALSPGVNDPFTAVTALHWLGAATAKLGNRDLVKNVCDAEEGEQKVHPLPDDFSHYVGRGFASIRSGAASSPIAAEVMMEVLENCAATVASPRRRERLLVEARLLMEQVSDALKGPDLREVKERYETLEQRFRGAR